MAGVQGQARPVPPQGRGETFKQNCPRTGPLPSSPPAWPVTPLPVPTFTISHGETDKEQANGIHKTRAGRSATVGNKTGAGTGLGSQGGPLRGCSCLGRDLARGNMALCAVIPSAQQASPPPWPPPPTKAGAPAMRSGGAGSCGPRKGSEHHHGSSRWLSPPQASPCILTEPPTHPEGPPAPSHSLGPSAPGLPPRAWRV